MPHDKDKDSFIQNQILKTNSYGFLSNKIKLTVFGHVWLHVFEKNLRGFWDDIKNYNFGTNITRGSIEITLQKFWRFHFTFRVMPVVFRRKNGAHEIKLWIWFIFISCNIKYLFNEKLHDISLLFKINLKIELLNRIKTL